MLWADSVQSFIGKNRACTLNYPFTCTFYDSILRDINLTNTESPLASKIAPNGDPYSALLCVDYNAMYLWSEEQDLPLSPGIRWSLSNGYFVKKPLASNTSLSAVQWIYFKQAELKDSGSNVVIQHGYHQGEETIHGFQVDGFAVIDGQPTVYEYNGCTVSFGKMFF